MEYGQLKTSELNAFIESVSGEFTEGTSPSTPCYVLARLSCSEYEETNEVVYQGCHCIQKIIKTEYDLGVAYEHVYALQQSGNKCDGYFPRIFVCSRHDGVLEVIQEYVEGMTLLELLDQGPLDVERIHDIFLQVCVAVNSLSEYTQKHFVCRDIKPSNICVVEDEKHPGHVSVALIDLSLARIYDDTLHYDVRCFGTRSYAPPEQFGYRQTDVRADIYALGRVLYALWTGENPIGALTIASCMKKGIPSEAASIIERATKFDPDQRFQSIAEVCDAYRLYSSYSIQGTPFVDTKTPRVSHHPLSPFCAYLNEKYALSADTQKYLSWVGCGWNAALIFVAFFLVAASTDALVDVLFLGSFVQHFMDLGLGFVLIYLVCLPLLYLVSYKEPLYHLLHVKQVWSLPKTAFVYVVCLLVAAVLMSLVPYVFLP